MATFNAPLTLEASTVEMVSQRKDIIHSLFDHVGESVYIEPPLNADYGCNIRVGDGFYANFQ